MNRSELLAMINDDILNWVHDASRFNDSQKLPADSMNRLLAPGEDGCSFPCPLTGNVELANPIVSVSLNPGWGNGTAQEHARFGSPEEWASFCVSRFPAYAQYGERLHHTFHHLHRVLLHDGQPASLERKLEDLDGNLINLDWCPFYSPSFNDPRPGMTKYCPDLVEKWDGRILNTIKSLQPRRVFLHGKSQQALFDMLSSGKGRTLEIEGNSRTNVIHKAEMHDGTPLIYSLYFLGYSSRYCQGYTGLDTIRQFIHEN